MSHDSGHKGLVTIIDAAGSVHWRWPAEGSWQPVEWSAGSSADAYTAWLQCYGAGGNCGRSRRAHSYVRRLWFTLADRSAPTLSLGGSLFEPGPRRGPQSAQLAATDVGGGVWRWRLTGQRLPRRLGRGRLRHRPRRPGSPLRPLPARPPPTPSPSIPKPRPSASGRQRRHSLRHGRRLARERGLRTARQVTRRQRLPQLGQRGGDRDRGRVRERPRPSPPRPRTAASRSGARSRRAAAPASSGASVCVFVAPVDRRRPSGTRRTDRGPTTPAASATRRRAAPRAGCGWSTATAASRSSAPSPCASGPGRG